MAYSFTKLDDYQTWDVFDTSDSSINTNEALDTTETVIDVTPSPVGTINIGDTIAMSQNNNINAGGGIEIMDVTNVSSTQLTVTRGVRGSNPHTFNTARDIYLVANPLSEPILIGDHLSNNTRAGEAVLISTTRSTFNLYQLTSIQLLVISGSFLSGDNISASSGGDFTLNGTKTTVTKDTIIVEGESSTDSTANTNEAIDNTETDWTVTSSSVFKLFDYIKTDSEYCLVVSKPNATTITVERGRLGSTAATHTTATDIYIVDKPGFKTIADEMVTQGWGTIDFTGAKIDIDDANIMIGLTDQTSNTVFIANLESMIMNDNEIYVTENSTYNTTCEIGVGSIGSKEDNYKGLTGNGCLIEDAQFIHLSGTLNLYGSIFVNDTPLIYSETNIKHCIFQGDDVNGSLISGTDTIKIIQSVFSGINLIPATSTLISDELTIERTNTYSFYVITGSDSITNGITGINSGTVGAFASDGEKKYIDCDVDWVGVNILSSASFTWYYTLAITIVDIEGTPIENVKVTLYQKSDNNEEFNVLTDSDGKISEEVYRAVVPSGLSQTANNRGPFRLVLQLEGYETVIQDFDFDDKQPVDYTIVMKRSPYVGAMGKADCCI